MIKTFSEFINESFNSGFSLSITTIDKRGQKDRNNYMFDREDDARKFMIDWLEKHPGGTIEYFDICSGSNYSDPDCLDVWGGTGGYFANIAANGGYKHRQQFSYKEIKEIERCEVDINTFLRIR